MARCHGFRGRLQGVQLDVESLRTLVTVLDQGGMTRAADRLGLSQSSVSWKIKRLEQKVGKPLLIRDGHTLRPTRDGRDLIEDARTIITLHDRAVARLRSSELTGLVRVGANEEIGAERVADVLGRFRRDHPAAMVEFRLGPTERLIDEVDAGGIDVAVIQITGDDIRPSDELLWSEQLRFVSSPTERFEVGRVPLVTFGEHCFYRGLSEPLLDVAEIDYSVALSVATTSGVRAAVAAGLGVGVLGCNHLGPDVVEWTRAAELGTLPCVHQVARTVPGEQRDVAAELAATLVAELRDPAAEVA